MTSINRIAAQNVSQAYVQGADGSQTSAGQTAGKVARQNQQPAPKTDSVTLSDNARSLANAREAVQQAPAVREEKVAESKQPQGGIDISMPTTERSTRVFTGLPPSVPDGWCRCRPPSVPRGSR